MEAMIHIGNAPGTPDYAAIADALVAILHTGYDTHAEQDTIQKALGAFTAIGEVKNITISGATLTNNPPPSEPNDTVGIKIGPSAMTVNPSWGDDNDD